MDLNNVSKILKKINRLYDLINEIGEASQTEKDLLKAYVIDLYDSIAMSDIEEVKDLEAEQMAKKIKKRKKLEKKLKKQKHKDTKSSVVEDEVEVRKVKSQIATQASHEAEIKKVDQALKEEIKKEPVTIAESVQPKVDGALQELFVMDGNSSEISDKLSQTPIQDLTRAMSINERIFTQNELFGGNKEEMDNMLVALNGLSTFEEAKNVLMRSVASKYDWTSAGKLKKARNFIKLVQRRYN